MQRGSPGDRGRGRLVAPGHRDGLTLRNAGERPLDQMPQRREGQSQADQGQGHKRRQTDGVLRQVQRLQQRDDGEHQLP
jgi:hypothetical protein